MTDMLEGGRGKESRVNGLVQLPSNTKVRCFLVREQYLSQLRQQVMTVLERRAGIKPAMMQFCNQLKIKASQLAKPSPFPHYRCMLASVNHCSQQQHERWPIVHQWLEQGWSGVEQQQRREEQSTLEKRLVYRPAKRPHTQRQHA